MSEPSYEELKERVAELEKKGAGRRTGSLEFRVGEKGGVSVYGLGHCPQSRLHSANSGRALRVHFGPWLPLPR